MRKLMDKLSNKDTIVIFGGSGFIGKYLIRNVLPTGAKIIVASLHNRPLKDLDFPQISLIQCDIKNKEQVFNASQTATHLVNLVGLRFEEGDNNFENTHVTGACHIALAAKEYQVKRLLHVSVLTNNIKSRYGETKLRAQEKVLSIFPTATIIRPCLVYGREGKFINIYANMIRKSYFVPVLWGGRTRTQPLYVEDVALFLYAVLEADGPKVWGKILNIVGPKQYAMSDIVNFLLLFSNKKRVVFPLPGWAGYIMGYVCEKFGIKFMTRDLVLLMKENFLLRDDETNAMPDFGIQPRAVEEAVPTYLKL